MGLLVFTRITNMKDFSSEIILLVEIRKNHEGSTHEHLCILRIYNSLKSK